MNHNGDVSVAHQWVKAAGADYVKFQTFQADLCISPQAPKAAYQVDNTGKHESQLEMVRRLQLDRAAHHALLESCQQAGIRFLSTGFDLPSLGLLRYLNLDFVEIPSGEVTNLPLLRAAARQGKPKRRIYLSLGGPWWRRNRSRQGEPFSEQNLACKRPGHGLSPMLWDQLLGRPSSRAYATDELIDEGMFRQ